MMIVTIIFCCHNAAVFILMLLSSLLIHLQVKMLSTRSLNLILHPFIPSSSSSSSVAQFSKMDPEQVRMIIDESEDEVWVWWRWWLWWRGDGD